MKITFQWSAWTGRLMPTCGAEPPDRDDTSLVACLMQDTGGSPYLNSVPWLEEGLRRVDALKRDFPAPRDWSREDWGARLEPDRVTIFSMHDESFAATMSLDAFRTVLAAWTEFIQTPADPHAVRTFEV